MLKLFFGALICFLCLSCLCFTPCPMSPSGYAHLGCLPPGVTIYYQNETAKQQEQTNPDIQVPSSNQSLKY